MFSSSPFANPSRWWCSTTRQLDYYLSKIFISFFDVLLDYIHYYLFKDYLFKELKKYMATAWIKLFIFPGERLTPRFISSDEANNSFWILLVHTFSRFQNAQFKPKLELLHFLLTSALVVWLTKQTANMKLPDFPDPLWKLSEIQANRPVVTWSTVWTS